jgi:hypothetical protein
MSLLILPKKFVKGDKINISVRHDNEIDAISEFIITETSVEELEIEVDKIKDLREYDKTTNRILLDRIHALESDIYQVAEQFSSFPPFDLTEEQANIINRLKQFKANYKK